MSAVADTLGKRVVGMSSAVVRIGCGAAGEFLPLLPIVVAGVACRLERRAAIVKVDPLCSMAVKNRFVAVVARVGRAVYERSAAVPDLGRLGRSAVGLVRRNHPQAGVVLVKLDSGSADANHLDA